MYSIVFIVNCIFCLLRGAKTKGLNSFNKKCLKSSNWLTKTENLLTRFFKEKRQIYC